MEGGASVNTAMNFAFHKISILISLIIFHGIQNTMSVLYKTFLLRHTVLLSILKADACTIALQSFLQCLEKQKNLISILPVTSASTLMAPIPM